MATSPSGKSYIGQTVERLSKRIKKHQYDANTNDYAFARAIRKYGIDNIKWKVIHNNIPVEDLSEMEIVAIAKYNTYHAGYNETIGGEGSVGFRHNDKSKERMSKILKKQFETGARNQSGEHNNRSVLTWHDVSGIREEYLTGKYTQSEIAKKYGVSRRTIGLIIKNETWADSLYSYVEIKHNVKFNNSMTKEIVEKYNTGKFTSLSLADKYNVSFQTICYILDKHGDDLTKKTKEANKRAGTKLMIGDITDIMEKIENGKYIKDIAGEYNVGVSTMSRFINDYRNKRGRFDNIQEQDKII